MKKIRLTESQFDRLVGNCVKKIIKESFNQQNERVIERYFWQLEDEDGETIMQSEGDFENEQEAFEEGEEEAIYFATNELDADYLCFNVYQYISNGDADIVRCYKVFQSGSIRSGL